MRRERVDNQLVEGCVRQGHHEHDCPGEFFHNEFPSFTDRAPAPTGNAHSRG